MLPRDHWLSRLLGLAAAPSGTFVAERPLPEPEAEHEAGDLLQGRRSWRLVERIGSGAYGTVWRAEGEGEIAAVKVLSPRLRHRTRLDALRRELSSLLAVVDRSVPEVLDWQLDAALPFVVIEHFAGGSLDARLAREGALADEALLPLLETLLMALSAARRACLLHLDIKPQNVLLRADGSFALADFGTAQAELAEAELTGGIARGSRGYRAPEQGRPDGKVDHRSDLFGAAATVWAAATGIDLASPRGLRVTAEAVGGAALPPASRFRPSLPRRVDELLVQMLAVDPQARPSDAAEVLTALRALAAEAPPLRGRSLEPEEAAAVRAALVDPLWVWLSTAEGAETPLLRFAPGELLVEEGEASHHVFVLLVGRVRVLRGGLDLALESREGSFLGEVAALTGGPRTARMEALDEVVVMRLDVLALERMVTRHPAVGIRLIHAMADRLAQR